jgi:hypothetical protein
MNGRILYLWESLQPSLSTVIPRTPGFFAHQKYTIFIPFGSVLASEKLVCSILERQAENWQVDGGPQRMSEQNLYTIRDTLKIDQPATYRIQVAGYLDENWTTRLGGLRISTDARDDDKLITMLSGELIDQAALFGVLKALYDMRLPLLSVECLEVA